MDKLIKASSVIEIISRYRYEAVARWDVDAAVVCKEIIREIDALPGEDYATIPQEKEDKL